MSDFPNGYLTTGNKPVINDVYKASEEYLKEQQRQDNLYNDEGDIYESAINKAFVAGAEWMARQGYVVEDEIAMCYNNGEPTGLSLYDFDIDNNTIGLKDGDIVIIQVRKK